MVERAYARSSLPQSLRKLRHHFSYIHGQMKLSMMYIHDDYLPVTEPQSESDFKSARSG
jgi:hypothetical protein